MSNFLAWYMIFVPNLCKVYVQAYVLKYLS